MVLDGLCSDWTFTFCLEFVQGSRASKCHHPKVPEHFWGLPVQVDERTNGRSWERTNVAGVRGVVIDQGRWWKVKYHEKAFSYRLRRLHFSFPALYSITGGFWKRQVRSLPHMRRVCVRDLTSAWWTEWKWCRKKWNWVGGNGCRHMLERCPFHSCVLLLTRLFGSVFICEVSKWKRRRACSLLKLVK